MCRTKRFALLVEIWLYIDDCLSYAANIEVPTLNDFVAPMVEKLHEHGLIRIVMPKFIVIRVNQFIVKFSPHQTRSNHKVK